MTGSHKSLAVLTVDGEIPVKDDPMSSPTMIPTTCHSFYLEKRKNNAMDTQRLDQKRAIWTCQLSCFAKSTMVKSRAEQILTTLFELSLR